MDVAVSRHDDHLMRSVYRKPTFTGLYTRWDSFVPTSQKINLIKSLTSRAKKICSPSMLEAEVAKLMDIFVKNGYPAHIVDRTIRQVLQTSSTVRDRKEEGQQCASLRLPWIGHESIKFRREFHETVQRAFPGVKSRMTFTTQHAFSGKAKDVLPATDQSLLVYEYTCCCGCTYVGKTIQRFSERIRQHVPEKLLAEEPVLESARSDSAVTRHLKRSPACISEETRGRFKVLARARSEAHLNVLEALFILKFTPTLCCQKDFVRVLKLFSKWIALLNSHFLSVSYLSPTFVTN